VALQLAWGRSGLGGAAPDRRKADMRIDNAWGILLDRLESYSFLPAANHPRATRARERLDTISPSNREWLKLVYEVEWAASTKRLGWIEEQGLAKDINELAGPECLLFVKKRSASAELRGDTSGAHAVDLERMRLLSVLGCGVAIAAARGSTGAHPSERASRLAMGLSEALNCLGFAVVGSLFPLLTTLVLILLARRAFPGIGSEELHLSRISVRGRRRKRSVTHVNVSCRQTCPGADPCH
jgi:hypothetical protein